MQFTSVDQALRLLPDALQHTRLRHVDGRDGQPELRGRLCPAGAVEGQPPEGPQRGGFEL